MKKYILLLLICGGCGDNQSTMEPLSLEPVSLNLESIRGNLEDQCNDLAVRFSDANNPQCLTILTEAMCEAKYQFNIKKAALDFETSYKIAEANLLSCNAYTNNWFRADCAAHFQEQIAWALSDCGKIH